MHASTATWLIVANNGALFSESALKGAHFLIELRDNARSAAVPAEHRRFLMVGRDYEAGGIAAYGAKIGHRGACARVPKLTVVIGDPMAGNYSMVRTRVLPRFL